MQNGLMGHGRRVAMLVMLLLLGVPGWAAQKVALVIGNGAYTHNKPLAYSVNDAIAVGAHFRKLGYDTVLMCNATYKDMRSALKQLREKLKGGQAVVFYYSGYSVEIYHQNYLVPVDVIIDDEGLVSQTSMRLLEISQIINESATPIGLMVLDACRDNHFATIRRSVSRDFLQMPQNSDSERAILLYAASPGKLAVDHNNCNGVFTGEFLRYLEEPGLPISQFIEQVRRGVEQQTQGKQVVYSEEGPMLPDFSFVPSTPP